MGCGAGRGNPWPDPNAILETYPRLQVKRRFTDAVCGLVKGRLMPASEAIYADPMRMRQVPRSTREIPTQHMVFIGGTPLVAIRPVANTRPGFPWLGILHRVYSVKDPGYLEQTFGPIKSRIKGGFAKGTPPSGTASDVDFRGFLNVLPFLLRLRRAHGKQRAARHILERATAVQEDA